MLPTLKTLFASCIECERKISIAVEQNSIPRKRVSSVHSSGLPWRVMVGMTRGRLPNISAWRRIRAEGQCLEQICVRQLDTFVFPKFISSPFWLAQGPVPGESNLRNYRVILAASSTAEHFASHPRNTYTPSASPPRLLDRPFVSEPASARMKSG